jgi:hypothetical protein
MGGWVSGKEGGREVRESVCVKSAREREREEREKERGNELGSV